MQEKDRQEKKAAKAEREKKNKESQDKSRNLMANFFGKAKNKDTLPSPLGGDSVATQTQTQTQFEKTFKHFVLKKDVELAPVNWFMEAQKKRERERREIIVIDEGHAFNVVMEDQSKVVMDCTLMSEKGSGIL
jgi:chromatin assembly factor 1 subunit A